jgi:hypothetical protein
MTNERVVALFREAWGEGRVYRFDDPKHWPEVEAMFLRAARLIEAEVREECAQVCDRQMDIEEIHPAMAVAAGNCADAIRFGEAEG